MFKTLQRRILFSYMILILIALIMLTSLFYYQESRHLIELAQANSLEMNALHAQRIGDTIQTQMDHLMVIRDQRQGNVLNQRQLLGKLNLLKKDEHTLFVETFIILPSGIYITPDGDSNDITDRNYFWTLFNNNPTTIVSEPIVGRTSNMPVILLIVPIYDDSDTVIGGVGGSIPLDTLSGELTTVKHPGESYGWIIDETGLTIAHPVPEYRMNVYIQDTDDIGYPGLSEIGVEMIRTQQGVGEYYDTNSEEAKIVTYFTIPNTQGWRLGITTLKKDIFQPLERLLQLVATVSVLTSILLLIITSYLSKRITRPIVQLTEAVRHSEKHDFMPLDIEETDDEIGQLVRAYNTMTDSIERYTNDLQSMVESRTHELNVLNRQLDERNKRLNNLNTRLFDLATRDKLTGLLNRGHILTEIMHHQDDVKLGVSNQFSLLFLDLDNFKYYNDTFGHDLGDQMLLKIGNLIRSRFRGSDVVGRYGGDEFLVILPETSREQAVQAAEKLVHFMKEQNGFIQWLQDILDEDQIEIPPQHQLWISIGIATYNHGDNTTVDQLIHKADQDMYKMKRLHKQALHELSNTKTP